MDASTKTIIGVIAGMLGLCLIIVVLYFCGCLKNPRKSDDTDAETGTSDSLPMKESTETEKVHDLNILQFSVKLYTVWSFIFSIFGLGIPAAGIFNSSEITGL